MQHKYSLYLFFFWGGALMRLNEHTVMGLVNENTAAIRSFRCKSLPRKLLTPHHLCPPPPEKNIIPIVAIYNTLSYIGNCLGSIKDLLIFMKGSLRKLLGELFPRLLLCEHLMRLHIKESSNISSLMCLCICTLDN